MLTVSCEAKNCNLPDFFVDSFWESIDGLLAKFILEFSALHSVGSVLVRSYAAIELGSFAYA